MTEEELKQLREQIRADVVAELQEEQPTRAELEEQVREELAPAIRAELEEERERRAELEAFAAEVCGSDEVGLSVPPEELVELMAGMEPEQVETLQEVLRAKVVEFGERGSSREGSTGTKELDSMLARYLRQWVESKGTIEEWFELNADEVGEMDVYDLSAFEEREA